MKPEAQIIAIAKACGRKTAMCPIHHQTECCGRKIPDYLNDLNAMAEAEKVIRKCRGEKGCDYFECLDKIIGNPNERACVFATAAQRAKAFLRTLNLWVD